MKLRFKKLFLSVIAFAAIVESFEAQAMQNEEGSQRGRKGRKFRPAQQRKQNISPKNINEDSELPSRFASENKATIFPCRCDFDYDKYMQFHDFCFSKVRYGNEERIEHLSNVEAAIYLSRFYQSLQFIPGPPAFGCCSIEESRKRSIRSYDIAKKFAKIAADGGGNPEEYIHLTGLGYAAERDNYGKEMKECTKWMIKEFLKHPYDPQDPNHFYAMINSDIWEPRYVDQKSLAFLENYIATSYHKNGNVRLTKALMLWKGFFGVTENNNERAFRIACQECVLSDKADLVSHNTLSTAGSLLFGIAKKRGYDPEKERSLYELAMYGLVNKAKKPLQIIQESTRLLQYYKVVPEQITQQPPKKKKTLRLDLHGKDKGKSAEEVMQFLNYMTQDKSIKYSIIITGKGKHSPGHNPILKPFVQNMLEEIAKDRIFSIEYNEDVGQGAFRVWLQS